MKQRAAHILVVDDEQLVEYMILQKFRRQIRDEQYRFLFAPNGSEAIEKLRAELPIDMILTDIRMPEMDGLTLLEKLKEIDQDIKTVVVSAYGDLRNIRAAMNRGAFDFLTKPIDLDDLDLTIQKTLDHINRLRSEQAQLRLAQEQIRYFAFHDVLTNLMNRAWFLRMLTHAIELNQRDDAHTYAILLLDLDRFKVINDSHGHTIGDYLLISVAARLQECVRSSDSIARLGGDEFAILLENIQDMREVLLVIQRIREKLNAPFQIGEHQFHISASIGITTSTVGYAQAERALRDADVAMYRAKREADGYTLFDTSMHTQIAERLQIENDIRQGIARGEFQNFYQPIVDFVSGRLIGFEVLARWKHPTQGWISPARFIAIAEETGLIHELSRILFRQACQQLRAWQLAYPTLPIQLNINVSPIQLRSTTLVRDLQEALEAYQIAGESIKLELIESALLDEVHVYTKRIFELLDLGLRLCIDDFGTGYSSLSRLHAFPIATLKIDQSFVRQMGHSEVHFATVKIIIALAQMLGMNVVAEGIESDAERNILQELGCVIGQGYLFSPPLAADGASAYLAGYLA